MDIDALICEKFKIINKGSLPFKSQGGTRDTLAEFLGEIGCKTGAEIGVWRAVYSSLLCHSIPGLKLKCIDPWLTFRRNSQDRMDSYFATARRRMRRYDAEIIRKPSMEAVKEVPDKSLDFVYIDAMHEFDPVMLDLIYWSEKVRVGGMIAGHDYSPKTRYNGVMEAVNSYTEAHNITSWYITDEEHKSFFWIKV